MNQIVYLRAMNDPSLAPCVVFVDLQKEHIAVPRLMTVPEAAEPLSRCRSVLCHARAMGFPVAHVRQVSRAPYFNPATDFSDWISGFEPFGTDMVFDRNKPSCYSNGQFAELMESCGGHFVIAGFAGETACLSTAIDAYHRNHRFTYLHDASASHRLGSIAAAKVQESVTQIIGVYGKILTTNSWINATSHLAEMPEGNVNEQRT